MQLFAAPGQQLGQKAQSGCMLLQRGPGMKNPLQAQHSVALRGLRVKLVYEGLCRNSLHGMRSCPDWCLLHLSQLYPQFKDGRR